MHKTILTSLFGILSFALLAAAQDEAEIKRIQEDYETIEKSFPEWPTHEYNATGLPGGQGLHYHLARSEEEPALMCVRIRIDDDHGPIDVANYFKGQDLEYVVRRQETVAMQENAPAVVVENRYYFAQGRLIQAWQKKASFPADQTPDMHAVKDKQLDLEKIEDADSLYEQFSSKALEAFVRLSKVLSDDAADGPGAGSHRVGDGWRLIQGTESPRYQELGIGWHVKGGEELEKNDDGTMFYGPDPDKVENVVVDLNSGSIIGKTNGQHSSDKALFIQAQMTNETVWSSSREFMVQLAQAKHFDTLFAELYYLPEMQSVSAGTDVLAAVKSAMLSKMSGKIKAEDLALGLHDVLVAQRGNATVLSVGANVMLSDGEGPDLTVTFKVTPNGKDGAPKLTLQDLVVEK